MSLGAPLPGAYLVISLDPVASLERLDDPIVRQQCQEMKCGKYVACATKEKGAFGTFFRYCTFTFDLVVQGLPPDDPSTFFHQSMTIPILPNTSHPTSRRPARATYPLPWNDCYHASCFRVEARCETRHSRSHPHSCLSFWEADVLDDYLNGDAQHVFLQELARDSNSGTAFAPVGPIGEKTLREIRAADRQPPTTVPWWHKLLESPGDDQSDVSDETSSVASSPIHSHAQDAENAPSHDSWAEIIAALLGQSASSDLAPFVQYSYDLSAFDKPPHPSGFLDELAQLEKIKADFVDRYQQRLRDVEASDAAYMASLEARGMQVKAKLRSSSGVLPRIGGMFTKARSAARNAAVILRPTKDTFHRSSSSKAPARQSLGERIVVQCAQRLFFYTD
ncbi:hypothetical protein BD626DRAFT_440784 [Schizophyllum amplum]|uniref:Uncharacterized protein n=1 Tax=Schizophyllum amplum TaxID=97359 RepID=A0A550BVN1_9AGAR|nr:hypothetical protein BD626DRAFT_440784 [Auriculariopsis ampla]